MESASTFTILPRSRWAGALACSDANPGTTSSMLCSYFFTVHFGGLASNFSSATNFFCLFGMLADSLQVDPGALCALFMTLTSTASKDKTKFCFSKDDYLLFFVLLL